MFRGAVLGEYEVDAYQPGEKVAWVSFTSASLSQRMARRFGNVLFRIHTRDRACIARAAAQPHEQVVLFPPWATFRVVRQARFVEIELCDILIDPEMCQPMTWEAAREATLCSLRLEYGVEVAMRLIDGPKARKRIESLLAGRIDPDPAVFAKQLRESAEACGRDPAVIEAMIFARREEAKLRVAAGLRDTSLLFDAVRRAEPDKVRRMLAAGVSLDYLDEEGDPIVVAAATRGDSEVVALLVDAGADVDAVSETSGEAALHRAIRNDHVDAVRVLLSAGVNLDALVAGDVTPLMYAAITGADKVAVLLLAAGADPNEIWSGGLPALTLAADKGHYECVRVLLRAGADCEILDFTGATPLHHSVTRSSRGTRALLEAGADPNARGPKGRTPAMFCFGNPEEMENLRELIQAGADLTIRTLGGSTALLCAIESGTLESVVMVLDAVGGVNAADEEDFGVLHWAAERGDAAIAFEIAKRVADVNARDRIGSTALLWAALRGHVGVVRVLLEAGADQSLGVYEHGFTPLAFARHEGHHEIVTLLEEDARRRAARRLDGVPRSLRTDTPVARRDNGDSPASTGRRTM